MSGNIRDLIVEQRKARLARTGRDEECGLPFSRDLPLAEFLGKDGLICEVKRRSPSRGVIAEGLDAAGQAQIYVDSGVRNISVLTVSEGFGGSLEDLRQVKRAFPNIAVLRKDFLFDETDIDVSWRAGADAVLLIAGMLTADRLAAMYGKAKSLGMEALLEIHDFGDLEKAKRVRPAFVGINSRDLETFAIDPLLPVKVRSGIDWPAKAVYESGVSHPETAAFAISSGFDGILVGEAAVKNPGLAARLREAMETAGFSKFWPLIGKRLREAGNAPLVKICGLTREKDARLAAGLGADALGFVFWSDSKRKAGAEMVRALRDLDLPKVGVVVSAPGSAALDPRIRGLLEDGSLDAVQMHGGETADDCFRLWPTYFKAVRPGNADAVVGAEAYRCPRILLDASAEIPGGSGERVEEGVLGVWKRPLWLAGGLTPENIGAVVANWRPELVDTASGVESSPGVKSGDMMRRFIANARPDSRSAMNGCR
ncbi:MAG: bifunctional indole-3-glycerol phosphate synthase/phosphoribosylanthranilate isomerase [Planctomycetota bacterium]|jgi:indole-3-glycerol phosphate synthase/phosphoribosylanthranilate isomerase|nr:bifunctional indole-3-glycerol phosphate synthase/phosphoribosylanthranilate isomerase [Planctomycetota bacterium]